MAAIATITFGILWAISGFDLPFEDQALDASSATADAVVTSVERTSVHINNQHLEKVTYVWHWDERELTGACYGRAGQFVAGRAYPLEYLPSEPPINRLRGGTRAMTSHFGGWLLLLWGIPVLLLAWWFRGVLRLRGLLRDGVAAAGEVLSAEQTTMVNPPQINLRYAFVDGQGTRQTGSQWIGIKSEFGKELRAGRSEITVLYDPLDGRHHRVATAADFR